MLDIHSGDVTLHPETLTDKIRNKTARICIVGLGYAGLPTAVAFAEKGFDVLGADIDEDKVEMINRGESPIRDLILDNRLIELEKSIQATTDIASAVSESDVVSIVVPTPVTEAKEPDLSYVFSASQSVSRGLKKGQLIILESTTYPGTTEEVVKPVLEESGLRTPEDFGLGYCPERFNPADPDHTMEKMTRIASANSEEWAQVVKALFESIVREIVLVRNIKTAEAAKVVENAQRDLNIALMNELALIFERMGIDVIDVIEAASTKWNFIEMYPGPGVGGHCLPVDPYYLTHKSRELGYDPRVILAGRYVNSLMPDHAVSLVENGLKEVGKSIDGSEIAILGLAFKPNIGDMRESPSVEIAQKLKEGRANVRVHDPMVENEAVQKILKLENMPLESALEGADCVIITTDHDRIREIAIEQIQSLAKDGCVLVDTRNVFNPDRIPEGMVYRGIGRIRF
ncbi:MAG: nucleotide sugar dehydrogenase [Methanobacteriota archaeon]|nr:MAG: nucleotide sugar dehydrogenase [Euryarchaeota archaeon]